MVQKGYWAILPYQVLKSYPHLKLSPAGVVPQRSRRPRPIMDYSFTLVNQSSLPLAPKLAMQFGGTLQRILQRIAYADPTHGPPLLLKLDLSDGYYRIQLSPEAALELAVVLPGPTATSQWVGVPLCLPMGWSHSPPFFCSFTETAADLANAAISSEVAPPPHPLEETSQAHDVPRALSFCPTIQHPSGHPAFAGPLAHVDVYIDDFIGVAQQPRLQPTLRCLLHAVDQIFRFPAHVDDKPLRKQVISETKLAAGDGAWSTSKIILGWLLDTAQGTLLLPPHKADRLQDLLLTFSSKKRTSRKKWCSLLGELQSLLVDNPHHKRWRLRPLIHAALADWSHLTTTAATRPTPIATLVPSAPISLGSVDASGLGIGGFWLPTSHGTPTPTVFRYAFPPHIATRLVSHSNPQGDLTNSDFELAALITGAALFFHTNATLKGPLWLGSDNTAAVSWCKRGSTSTTGPNAHLLRWMAKLTLDHNMTLKPVFVPGTSNSLADFCSRSFHLQDAEFLATLNQQYPIKPSWTLVHPTPNMISNMTSALSTTMLPWASLNNEPRPLTPLGTSGKTSAGTCTSTQLYNKSPIPSYPCNSSPIATVGATYLPAKLLFAAKRWEMPFVPSARRSPTWDTPTHAFSHPEN
jgi:hypothetical protein